MRLARVTRRGWTRPCRPTRSRCCPSPPALPPLRSAGPEELLAFRTGAFRFTAPASLTGRPELVVPVHHRASGQRFGVGVLGPALGDFTLLRLASLLCPDGAALAV